MSLCKADQTLFAISSKQKSITHPHTHRHSTDGGW